MPARQVVALSRGSRGEVVSTALGTWGGAPGTDVSKIYSSTQQILVGLTCGAWGRVERQTCIWEVRSPWLLRRDAQGHGRAGSWPGSFAHFCPAPPGLGPSRLSQGLLPLRITREVGLRNCKGPAGSDALPTTLLGSAFGQETIFLAERCGCIGEELSVCPGRLGLCDGRDCELSVILVFL